MYNCRLFLRTKCVTADYFYSKLRFWIRDDDHHDDDSDDTGHKRTTVWWISDSIYARLCLLIFLLTARKCVTEDIFKGPIEKTFYAQYCLTGLELKFELEPLMRACPARNCLPRVSLGSPWGCLLYTSPSPRDGLLSRMPSSA